MFTYYTYHCFTILDNALLCWTISGCQIVCQGVRSGVSFQPLFDILAYSSKKFFGDIMVSPKPGGLRLWNISCKGDSNMEYENHYASNGKGNLGVTLGAIGTGLGVLGGGLNGIGGILGNGWGRNVAGGCCESDHFVNRYEAGKDARILSTDRLCRSAISPWLMPSRIDSRMMVLCSAIKIHSSISLSHSLRLRP